MNMARTCSAIALLMGGLSLDSFAQDAAGVPVGGMSFYPKVLIGGGYNDNITLLPAQEIDSLFFHIRPTLSLDRRGLLSLLATTATRQMITRSSTLKYCESMNRESSSGTLRWWSATASKLLRPSTRNATVLNTSAAASF